MLAVRLYLYQENYLPPRLGRFLGRIDGRGILVREGLGYTFRQDRIHEYVEHMKD
jgi:hypothetical protein